MAQPPTALQVCRGKLSSVHTCLVRCGGIEPKQPGLSIMVTPMGCTPAKAVIWTLLVLVLVLVHAFPERTCPR